MNPKIDVLNFKGKMERLAFDPACYHLGRAHYETLARFVERERRSVRNSGRYGGQRKWDDFDRGCEVLDLVAAMSGVGMMR